MFKPIWYIHSMEYHTMVKRYKKKSIVLIRTEYPDEIAEKSSSSEQQG